MLNVTTRHQGENWSSCLMTVPPNDPSDDLIIDLDDPPAGHRLAELLQALTGCSVERAELAIDDPTPSGPASHAEAVDAVARGIVAVTTTRAAALAANSASA